MKQIIQCSMIAAILLAANASPAQTADQLVTDGRAFLAQRNLTNANAKFTAAVAASQNHENANALVSVTRLLNLLYLPPTQNFLTRLGVSATGRDVYHWTAFIAKDTNRVPIAPVGVSGAEASPFWHTNALPEITNSLANLTRIINTNFLLNLTSNETTTAAVTVDYGDLLMLRAGLHFMEYFSYTLLAHDLDVQLTALRALYTNQHLNMERLLADHPHLLAFATTNDMPAARAAFANFADRYADASDFLRARPAAVTRMFNFAANDSKNERKFRQTLADLKTSLNGATVLSIDDHYTFFAGAHFSGQSPLRSFLPQFRAHRMVLGTLPDPTFGGLLIGHGADEEEDFILGSKKLQIKGAVVPQMRQPDASHGQPFHFSLRARAGRGYVVQASTNLVNWENVAAFIALSGAVDFTEAAGQLAHRFYRIVDQDRSMPVPGNNDFANALVLAGSPVSVLGYNRGATSEVGESLMYPQAGKTVWYSWTAPSSALYTVDAKGSQRFYPIVSVYTGFLISSLASVAGGYGSPVSFNAVAGQTYRISVDGSYYSYPNDGGFKLTIGQPPTIAFTSPANNSTFSVGSAINLQLTAADPEGALSKVEVRDSRAGLLAVLTTPPFTFSWTNAPQGNHSLTATDTDSSGFTATAFLYLSVPPANDFFTNRTVLAGAVVQTNGLFAGADRENGEPAPYGYRGGSVWFEWTAPSNGSFVVSANSKRVGNASSIQAPLLAVYTNSAPGNLPNLASLGLQGTAFVGVGTLPSQAAINAQGGVTYFIALEQYTYPDYDYSLAIFPAQPPVVTLNAPINGSTLYTTSAIPITVSGSDADGTVVELRLYVDGQLRTNSSGGSLQLTLTNLYPGTHSIDAVAKDNQGAVAEAYTSFLVVVPPPPNDNFANATPISGTAYSTNNIVTTPATRETGEPSHAGRTGYHSVWWVWTAPSNGTAQINLSASYSTAVGVYTGSAVGSLSQVASGTFVSTLNFTAVGGTTYYIAVDEYYSNSPGTIYSFGLNLLSPPANDNFANAIPISGASYASPIVNNVQATKETGEPNHYGNTGGGSVWWYWTAPKSGTVTIDTIGSGFDTTLGIYTGTAVNGLSFVVSDDDSGGNRTSRVSFAASSGVTYRIAVDGYSSSRGNVRLNLNQP